jgi:hypothetical membrane protein
VSARAGAACWLIAGAVYPTFEAIAASAVPEYRYAHDFISDLGRPDSPLSYVMNAAFAVQGTLFFAGAALLVRADPGRRVRLFLGCAAANVVGNLVVAAVPSGYSGIAWVHLTGAVLAIVGGNVAILAGRQLVDGPRAYRVASSVLGALGLASFGLLAIVSTKMGSVIVPAAVWERTSVYTIIGWQVLSAVVLLTRRRN